MAKHLRKKFPDGNFFPGTLVASSQGRLPEVGDHVAVLDVGAYGFTESMPLFLSHTIPAEVAVRGGRATVIRPRLEPGEWLDRQVMLAP